MASTSAFQVESQGSNPCARTNEIKTGDLVTFISAHPLSNKWFGFVVDILKPHETFLDEIRKKKHYAKRMAILALFLSKENEDNEKIVYVCGPKLKFIEEEYKLKDSAEDLGYEILYSSNLMKANI